MGCVISREVSSGIISEVKEEKNLSSESKKKVDEAPARNVVEAQNGENQKEEKKDGDGGIQVQRPRGERRRSKPNPRLSNPPKHVRGEQVAAGWPPWLTAVCGEALSGWIPRKADTFEKIDKVGLFLTFYYALVLHEWFVWICGFLEFNKKHGRELDMYQTELLFAFEASVLHINAYNN